MSDETLEQEGAQEDSNEASQDDPTYGLPPVLTADEAAAFLRMNAKTVYAAVAAGEMPGRKVRQRTVILRDALLQWLNTQERVRPRRRRSRR